MRRARRRSTTVAENAGGQGGVGGRQGDVDRLVLTRAEDQLALEGLAALLLHREPVSTRQDVDGAGQGGHPNGAGSQRSQSHPPGPAAGSEVSLLLPDLEVELECAVCSSTRETA